MPARRVNRRARLTLNQRKARDSIRSSSVDLTLEFKTPELFDNHLPVPSNSAEAVETASHRMPSPIMLPPLAAPSETTSIAAPLKLTPTKSPEKTFPSSEEPGEPEAQAAPVTREFAPFEPQRSSSAPPDVEAEHHEDSHSTETIETPAEDHSTPEYSVPDDEPQQDISQAHQEESELDHELPANEEARDQPDAVSVSEPELQDELPAQDGASAPEESEEDLNSPEQDLEIVDITARHRQERTPRKQPLKKYESADTVLTPEGKIGLRTAYQALVRARPTQQRINKPPPPRVRHSRSSSYANVHSLVDNSWSVYPVPRHHNPPVFGSSASAQRVISYSQLSRGSSSSDLNAAPIVSAPADSLGLSQSTSQQRLVRQPSNSALMTSPSNPLAINQAPAVRSKKAVSAYASYFSKSPAPIAASSASSSVSSTPAAVAVPSVSTYVAPRVSRMASYSQIAAASSAVLRQSSTSTASSSIPAISVPTARPQVSVATLLRPVPDDPAMTAAVPPTPLAARPSSQWIMSLRGSTSAASSSGSATSSAAAPAPPSNPTPTPLVRSNSRSAVQASDHVRDSRPMNVVRTHTRAASFTRQWTRPNSDHI